MSRASVKFDEVKELLLKDEEFRSEYEMLKPGYDAISQIIEDCAKQEITQEELTLRTRTQKSNTSRLESGFYNSSLDFLILEDNACTTAGLEKKDCEYEA